MPETDLFWKVNTAGLLEEILNSGGAAILEKPINIFGKLLCSVGVRASQLNDPVLNALMCRLAIYTIADPYNEDYDAELTSKIIKEGTMSDEEKADKPEGAMTPAEESIAIAKIKKRREPHPLQLLKAIRIDIAEAITLMKAGRKNLGAWKEYQLAKLLDRQRKEYRRLHIVYCELRGRTREQIETISKNPKKARSNMPDETRIDYERDYWGALIFKWDARHPVREEVAVDVSGETTQEQKVGVAT